MEKAVATRRRRTTSKGERRAAAAAAELAEYRGALVASLMSHNPPPRRPPPLSRTNSPALSPRTTDSAAGDAGMGERPITPRSRGPGSFQSPQRRQEVEKALAAMPGQKEDGHLHRHRHGDKKDGGTGTRRTVTLTTTRRVSRSTTPSADAALLLPATGGAGVDVAPLVCPKPQKGAPSAGHYHADEATDLRRGDRAAPRDSTSPSPSPPTGAVVASVEAAAGPPARQTPERLCAPGYKHRAQRLAAQVGNAGAGRPATSLASDSNAAVSSPSMSAPQGRTWLSDRAAADPSGDDATLYRHYSQRLYGGKCAVAGARGPQQPRPVLAPVEVNTANAPAAAGEARPNGGAPHNWKASAATGSASSGASDWHSSSQPVHRNQPHGTGASDPLHTSTELGDRRIAAVGVAPSAEENTYSPSTDRFQSVGPDCRDDDFTRRQQQQRQQPKSRMSSCSTLCATTGTDFLGKPRGGSTALLPGQRHAQSGGRKLQQQQQQQRGGQGGALWPGRGMIVKTGTYTQQEQVPAYGETDDDENQSPFASTHVAEGEMLPQGAACGAGPRNAATVAPPLLVSVCVQVHRLGVEEPVFVVSLPDAVDLNTALGGAIVACLQDRLHYLLPSSASLDGCLYFHAHDNAALTYFLPPQFQHSRVALLPETAFAELLDVASMARVVKGRMNDCDRFSTDGPVSGPVGRAPAAATRRPHVVLRWEMRGDAVAARGEGRGAASITTNNSGSVHGSPVMSTASLSTTAAMGCVQPTRGGGHVDPFCSRSLYPATTTSPASWPAMEAAQDGEDSLCGGGETTPLRRGDVSRRWMAEGCPRTGPPAFGGVARERGADESVDSSVEVIRLSADAPDARVWRRPAPSASPSFDSTAHAAASEHGSRRQRESEKPATLVDCLVERCEESALFPGHSRELPTSLASSTRLQFSLDNAALDARRGAFPNPLLYQSRNSDGRGADDCVRRWPGQEVTYLFDDRCRGR